MDLALRSESFGSGDQTFLVDPLRTQKIGCTLDLSIISSATLTTWENTIPAGVALAKVSSGVSQGCLGLYTPSGGTATNEIQTLTISGTPTGGTYTLTFTTPDGDEQTTAAIAYNANAAAIEAALEALSNLVPADVAVTGSGPFSITFSGAYAQTNVPQMTATASLTGGTAPAATVTTATGGVAGLDTGVGLLFDDVKFTVGATSGRIAASLIIDGAIYETKLPLASSASNTPGKVDAAFKVDLPDLSFVTL